MVPYLLQQLSPEHKYHVWLDNLFTSHNLLVYLREQGWGAAGISIISSYLLLELANFLYIGTAKAKSGMHKRMIELKKKEQSRDILSWGTLFKEVLPDSKVMQFGVKDNAFVLFQSTIHTGKYLYMSSFY